MKAIKTLFLLSAVLFLCSCSKNCENPKASDEKTAPPAESKSLDQPEARAPAPEAGSRLVRPAAPPPVAEAPPAEPAAIPAVELGKLILGKWKPVGVEQAAGVNYIDFTPEGTMKLVGEGFEASVPYEILEGNLLKVAMPENETTAQISITGDELVISQNGVEEHYRRLSPEELEKMVPETRTVPENALLGQWQSIDPQVQLQYDYLEFTTDGKARFVGPNMTVTMDYDLSGDNRLKIIMAGEEKEGEWSMSGDELTLTFQGNPQKYKRREPKPGN